MASVLLVDDDEGMRNALSRTLRNEGHTIILASSGHAAEEALANQAFDIVISDIKMPDGDGIQLTQFIRQNYPNIPVILMTGFSEIYSATQAYDVGANEFIPKPFKKEDLLSAIAICLQNPQLNQRTENLSDGYCKLSLIDFVSGKVIPADIYLRLSEKKFIKIAYKGDDLPGEQLEKFKKFGLIHLYMRKTDFNDYIGFNLQIGKKLSNNLTISKEKKLNFMKHTNEILMERIFLDGIDKDYFEMARTVTESTVNILLEDGKIFNLLSLLNSHSDELYAHSMGVSLYGAMLARHLHWSSPSTMFKISTGGLLHDIGKKELPRELIKKERGEMTYEEIELYESHPQRGVKILSEIRTIPLEILQIVSQHHENCVGLGFPSKLSRHNIYPLARLISIVDIFCNLTITKNIDNRMGVREALNHMSAVEAAVLDKEMFAALVEMCGGPGALVNN